MPGTGRLSRHLQNDKPAAASPLGGSRVSGNGDKGAKTRGKEEEKHPKEEKYPNWVKTTNRVKTTGPDGAPNSNTTSKGV